MSEELTMVAMMVIAAGAALFVAWPLMFGSICPDDFLETETAGGGLRQQSEPGATTKTPKGRVELEIDSYSQAPSEREVGYEPRADLDVELEIEAFRRHSQKGKQQDNTGRQ